MDEITWIDRYWHLCFAIERTWYQIFGHYPPFEAVWWAPIIVAVSVPVAFCCIGFSPGLSSRSRRSEANSGDSGRPKSGDRR